MAESRILSIKQRKLCPEGGAWQPGEVPPITEPRFPSGYDLFGTQGGRWRQKSEPSLPQCLLPDQGPPDVQTGFPGLSPHLTGYKQMKKWTKSCGLRKQSSNMGDISDLSRSASLHRRAQ